VADGPVWWTWLGRQGAISNQDDPSIKGNGGDELTLMFNPAPLLSALRFSVIGTSRVADRASITANAIPRPPDPHQPRFSLHQLGSGADLYTLEVDQERGALLAVTAIREKQPFQRVMATSLHFDEPMAAETFRFDLPEDEEVHSPRNRRRSQRVTLVEAQQLAPFTVLMPDHVPDTWQMRCTFYEASQRRSSPAELILGYRSGDGHESVSITQLAATDRASHHYENMVNTKQWQTVTRDGTTVRTRPADFGQAQAYLERDGTFAFLVSDNLTNEQLATIAARLIPAPATSSI
jgi:hypothetical protein